MKIYTFDPFLHPKELVLVGCGGTGSQLARAVARLVYSMKAAGQSANLVISWGREIDRQVLGCRHFLGGVRQGVEGANRATYRRPRHQASKYGSRQPDERQPDRKAREYGGLFSEISGNHETKIVLQG